MIVAPRLPASRPCPGHPAMGWVMVEKTPVPHINDMWDCGAFNQQKIIVEHKGKNEAHVTYAKAMKQLFVDLAAYVKDNHRTGLEWNPKGVSVAEAKSAPAAGGAPAPPPLAPPPMAPPVGGPPPPPPPRLPPPLRRPRRVVLAEEMLPPRCSLRSTRAVRSPLTWGQGGRLGPGEVWQGQNGRRCDGCRQEAGRCTGGQAPETCARR